MTDDLRAAFDHPLARAEAMGAPLDRISLRDHLVEAEIGAFQLERGVTQRLRFQIVVEVRPAGDAGDDDVDRILSYDRLTEAVQAELAAERLNLLETLAERVAARILREPQAERVFLRIEKLDRGPGDLGVEIVRARAGAPGAGTEPPPPPRLLLLGAGVDPRPVLDRWEGQGASVLLIPEAPLTASPVAQTAEPQRRIDLLAIEQAAWALASRDGRLIVAGTRTELDWALRRGQPAVWAPSKLVLDTPGAPEAMEAAALAAWLAGHLGVMELRLVGTEPPTGFAPPVPFSVDPA